MAVHPLYIGRGIGMGCRRSRNDLYFDDSIAGVSKSYGIFASSYQYRMIVV